MSDMASRKTKTHIRREKPSR